MTQSEVRQMNTTVLAFMGDAVYEEHVRCHVLKTGSVHADMLHKEAVKYVSAPGQNRSLQSLLAIQDFLSQDELDILRRAKNHRQTASKRARAGHGNDPMVDKMATAFEALLGYLYLTEAYDRLEAVIIRAIEVIDN